MELAWENSVSTTATSVARHWIDGEWADSDEHRDSVNPATGAVIGSYAMGGPKERRRRSRPRSERSRMPWPP
jgi:acyl-CoA reductase-like NAD-dependent aldehyde dehydrogenase